MRSPSQLPPPRPDDLSAAELEVLTSLWDEGASTVREVLAHLHERGRRVAYTTVLTFLSRLEQKGFVTADKTGLAYIYRPRVTRRRVTNSRVREVLETFFGGEAAPLMLHLVKEGKLTGADVEELQRLIDDLQEDAG